MQMQNQVRTLRSRQLDRQKEREQGQASPTGSARPPAGSPKRRAVGDPPPQAQPQAKESEGCFSSGWQAHVQGAQDALGGVAGAVGDAVGAVQDILGSRDGSPNPGAKELGASPKTSAKEEEEEGVLDELIEATQQVAKFRKQRARVCETLVATHLKGRSRCQLQLLLSTWRLCANDSLWEKQLQAERLAELASPLLPASAQDVFCYFDAWADLCRDAREQRQWQEQGRVLAASMLAKEQEEQKRQADAKRREEDERKEAAKAVRREQAAALGARRRQEMEKLVLKVVLSRWRLLVPQQNGWLQRYSPRYRQAGVVPEPAELSRAVPVPPPPSMARAQTPPPQLFRPPRELSPPPAAPPWLVASRLATSPMASPGVGVAPPPWLAHGLGGGAAHQPVVGLSPFTSPRGGSPLPAWATRPPAAGAPPALQQPRAASLPPALQRGASMHSLPMGGLPSLSQLYAGSGLATAATPPPLLPGRPWSRSPSPGPASPAGGPWGPWAPGAAASPRSMQVFAVESDGRNATFSQIGTTASPLTSPRNWNPGDRGITAPRF